MQESAVATMDHSDIRARLCDKHTVRRYIRTLPAAVRLRSNNHLSADQALYLARENSTWEPANRSCIPKHKRQGISKHRGTEGTEFQRRWLSL